MKGEHVHILEKDPIPGGACDGYKYQDIGYVMRGGREMDNHFECMWDLFRSIQMCIRDSVYSFTSCLRLTDAVWVALLAARGFTLAQIGLAEAVFHLTSLLCEVCLLYTSRCV